MLILNALLQVWLWFHKKEMKQKIFPQWEKQNVEFTSKVVMAVSSTKSSTFFQWLLFDLLVIGHVSDNQLFSISYNFHYNLFCTDRFLNAFSILRDIGEIIYYPLPFGINVSRYIVTSLELQWSLKFFCYPEFELLTLLFLFT